MNPAELQSLRAWFSGYCRSYYSENPEDQKNIVLKEEHTHRVCSNMKELAAALALDPSRTALAETVALFHDVGRFPQYRRYRTFKDSISTNHAALSAGVLVEENVLANLPDAERRAVLHAVTLHNVFSIPEKLEGETLLYLKLIRDADKLDIWRVFIEYYNLSGEDRASAVALGLPDTPEYSSEVLASVLRREMVNLRILRTLNDFKLLQLAWIFDLNFTRSLQLLVERSYIEGIASTLPRSSEIVRTIDSIREYVDAKLSANTKP